MKENSASRAGARTLQYELNAYLSLCEAVNTPRSLTCFILASNGQWMDLLQLKNHHDDQNVEHSALDYLVTSAMKKNPRLPLRIDTGQVALDKFLQCEELCKDTNRKIQTGEFIRQMDLEHLFTFNRARRIIRAILGKLTERDLDKVWQNCRFGPGSTSHVSGTDVSSSRKYSALGATPRLSHLLKKLIPTAWWVGAGVFEIPHVWHANVTTVPKSAVTDRPIDIQAHLNIWVQLGIGKLIRDKLRRAGLDLNTQADWNRFLASQAQAWGLATIDLESASDTIAEQLVRLLLPKRWVHLLEIARMDCTQMPDGTIIGLEKWSAMGNGYTFELESLIFYAFSLASSRCKALTTVFGDDIIVPQDCTTNLIGTLEYCGFRVNRSKTFLAGSFFESCGTDWLSGVNIRPFHFKSEVTTMEDAIDASFKACNQLRMYAHNLAGYNGSHGCDRRLLPAWLRILAGIPEHWRNCRVPAGFGEDRGIISNFDEARPTLDRTFGTYRFQYRSRPSAVTDIASVEGYVLCYTRMRHHWASKFLANHRAGQWSIGDYLKNDPTRTIKLRSGNVVVVDKPTNTALRGVRTKGQHAKGHVVLWPSLGPWQ